MANVSSSASQPNKREDNKREDLTNRRIRAFEGRYGTNALYLACHAAFPLTLTSDLLYCLRENFVPDVPWYAVADVLLSGLCQPAGYDLYEMEGKTRDALLRLLCEQFTEKRLKELANFMSRYIVNRLQVENNDRALVFGQRSQWTALAYFSSDEKELINAIRQELQKLTASTDAKERIRWAVLVESYADLLSEKGFEPLLKLSKQILDGQPIQDEEELQTFEFDTVTVDARGKVINKQPNQAFYFVEFLGEAAGKPLALLIDMVAIPGGTFEMGSPPDEPQRDNDENPQHRVTVQPFFLAKYPVTQEQWQFVAQLPQVKRGLNRDPSRFKGANRPVENVSWYDAVEFCLRLSQYTGRPYSLPSEAEWEYACRAGTTTAFHFGETITSKLANYNATARQKTTPVGSFEVANAFGLYDMHGNVYEWCLDDWHKNYEGAPADGRPWFGNNANFHQKQGDAVVRGGSWDKHLSVCRSASRNSNDRTQPALFNFYIGFRVACGVGREDL
ncbi:SUMF1/EgtB/PvdO family nonheme iron enzyme [Nostoc sp. CHAB 5784]|uniref:formylglycine-generating enzyme family protein n=1 Tax=Nostoc mirabile TaxID=2907820 RepID=UPI001E503929|nr:SUMF1/EgtB/PvdO family nonheme iron enzyme [Nostoc mirabile]MCC5664147.1 SUMF1/EgtB/PvdO family nonheme iron enzyme [Nostoc mirabile CHAB5784]